MKKVYGKNLAYVMSVRALGLILFPFSFILVSVFFVIGFIKELSKPSQPERALSPFEIQLEKDCANEVEKLKLNFNKAFGNSDGKVLFSIFVQFYLGKRTEQVFCEFKSMNQYFDKGLENGKNVITNYFLQTYEMVKNRELSYTEYEILKNNNAQISSILTSHNKSESA